MIALNLIANGNEQVVLKEYLQNNASETLAEKINNGVRIIKDGIPLISKKNLDSFMKHACDEAKKLAEKGANSACVHSDTVFNWAIHYFEEDSIEGVLYNADGTEFKPPKPKYEPKTSAIPVVPQKPQPKPQLTLFDLMESKENEMLIEESKDIANEENDDEDSFTEEEQQEIMQEISRQEADSEIYEVITEEEMRKFDGDVEEPKELLATSTIEKSTVTVPKTTIDNKVFSRLSELLGNILIAR